MAGENKKIKITISGRVQMVGFRYFTVNLAARLGIRGYVKNLPSGKVEIVAQGSEDKLKDMIDSVRRGPPAAEVLSIKVDRTFDTLEEFENFDVRI